MAAIPTLSGGGRSRPGADQTGDRAGDGGQDHGEDDGDEPTEERRPELEATELFTLLLARAAPRGRDCSPRSVPSSGRERVDGSEALRLRRRTLRRLRSRGALLSLGIDGLPPAPDRHEGTTQTAAPAGEHPRPANGGQARMGRAYCGFRSRCRSLCAATEGDALMARSATSQVVER